MNNCNNWFIFLLILLKKIDIIALNNYYRVKHKYK